MTVISAMKFNDNEGAIVSDEQSSTPLRKFDIADKVEALKIDNNIIIYGGTGASDFLHDISERFKEESGKIGAENVKQIIDIMGNIMCSTKAQYSNSYLQMNFAVSLSDLQRGYTVRGNERIELIDRDRIFKALNDNTAAFLSAGYLLLAKDKEQPIKIYSIDTGLGRCIPVARPYSSIGSGSDMAESELYSFFENKVREDRKNISPLDGLAALLNATNTASKKNQGVGGTPMIVIIKGDEVIRPSECNSKLATEIVRANKQNYLSKGFAHEALDALLFKNEDYLKVNEQMMSKVKNPSKFNLFLREYKRY